MPRFSDTEYTTILKTFYTHDGRLADLSSHLLYNALQKAENTNSIKPLEKWARAWKKCRLNIKKTYHKYGLLRAGDKKDIELLFNLYLNDKSVAKILSDASPKIQQMMIQIMMPHPIKISVKHPSRGYAERLASRLAAGFTRLATREGRPWIHNKE